MVGFASATSNGPKVVASQNPAQPALAATIAVDLPDNHVRHMRAHKKVVEVEEAPNASQASGAAEQAKPIVDETPTGSLKRTRPKKTKLLAQKNKRKIVDQQEANNEQAAQAEIESPVPRGFFDALFHGD